MFSSISRWIIVFVMLLFCIIAAIVSIGVGKGNVHEVIPGVLYRSAQLSPERLAELIGAQDLKTVINLRGANPTKTWYQEEREMTEALGMNHFDVNFSASRLPEITELTRLLQVLRNSPRPILVHCRSGVDRAGLASAVMLLLEGYSLNVAQRQTSLRYGIVRADSTGRQFLAQYHHWLTQASVAHSPQHFLDWADRHYVDAMGNMRFYLHSVNAIKISQDNETRLRDGYTFEISGDDFFADGWVFDPRNKSLGKNAAVMLDDHVLDTRYGLARESVARFFGITGIENSGWEVRTKLTGWPRRCYDMKLRLTRLDDSVWQSPPQARVCLE